MAALRFSFLRLFFARFDPGVPPADAGDAPASGSVARVRSLRSSLRVSLLPAPSAAKSNGDDRAPPPPPLPRRNLLRPSCFARRRAVPPPPPRSPRRAGSLQLEGRRSRRKTRVGAQLREHVHQPPPPRPSHLPRRRPPKHRFERAGWKRRHHRLELGVVQIVLADVDPPGKTGEPGESKSGPGPGPHARTRAAASIRRRVEPSRASSSSPSASASAPSFGFVSDAIAVVLVDGFPFVGFAVVDAGAEHGGERVRYCALVEFLDRRGNVEVLRETHAGRECSRREERLGNGKGERRDRPRRVLEHVGDGRPPSMSRIMSWNTAMKSSALTSTSSASPVSS